jgi:hypothetical protein
MQSETIPHPMVASPASGFSHAQPLQNLVVLSVVSFGIYPTYWLYRNLKALKQHKRLAISPGWRTFGAFIPLIGLLFFKEQLQLFADTATADGVPVPYSPWGRTLGFGLISAMAELPGGWSALAVGAVIFLLPVQRMLNEVWAIEQPGLPIRQRFSTGEGVLLVVCAVLWGLIIALSLIGDSMVIG